jgi:hypothetical protein
MVDAARALLVALPPAMTSGSPSSHPPIIAVFVCSRSGATAAPSFD